jgi:DNA polymerase alpha-associated DNA helicase A
MLEDHHDAQGARIQDALESEVAQAEERMEMLSQEELVRLGWALSGLSSVQMKRTLFGQLQYRMKTGMRLADTRLTQGSLVAISLVSEAAVVATATVVEVSTKVVIVALQKGAQQLAVPDGETVRLDLIVNTKSFDRQATALGKMCSPYFSGPRWLQHVMTGSQQLLAACENDWLLETQGVLGRRLPAPVLGRRLPGEFLNKSQRQAVDRSLKNRLSVIHGPPGTGKTSIVSQMLLQWKEESLMSHRPALVVAPSNVAVDHLVVCLAHACPGFTIVRVGDPCRSSKACRSYTLEAHLSVHPLARSRNIATEQLVALEAELSSLVAGKFKKKDLKSRKRAIATKMKDKRTEIQTLERQAYSEIIADCDCVLATANSAGHDSIESSRQFPLVVVDEAAQCSNAEALVPLSRVSKDGQLVLIGDHNQLAPIVKVPSPQDPFPSLFARLVETFAESGAFFLPMTLLDTQYRMNQLLAEWPSSEFYKSKLSTATNSASFSPECSDFPWPLAANPGPTLRRQTQ